MVIGIILFAIAAFIAGLVIGFNAGIDAAKEAYRRKDLR
jgi:ABC-type cobalt transport system substrate-binding protein